MSNPNDPATPWQIETIQKISGLPKDAGNENVDKRTERRIP